MRWGSLLPCALHMSPHSRIIVGMHHPWRRFRDEWGYVSLSFTPLADDFRALPDGATVWMDPTILQVEERYAITHEIVRLERGEPREETRRRFGPTESLPVGSSPSKPSRRRSSGPTISMKLPTSYG